MLTADFFNCATDLNYPKGFIQDALNRLTVGCLSDTTVILASQKYLVPYLTWDATNSSSFLLEVLTMATADNNRSAQLEGMIPPSQAGSLASKSGDSGGLSVSVRLPQRRISWAAVAAGAVTAQAIQVLLGMLGPAYAPAR